MSGQLAKWLQWISEASTDPWPDGSADSSPVDESTAVMADPTLASCDAAVSYQGQRDADGLCHIYGTLTYANGDVVMTECEHGQRHGDVVIISERSGISRLCGTYVHGKLQGRGKIVTSDTTVTEGFFRDGALHGPVRQIGIKKFREFRRQLLFVGHYRNGRPFGPCWSYRQGGGFVHGQCDHLGRFTGDAIAYIYPDFHTALLGKFEDGVMISAVSATVARVDRDRDGVLIVTQFEVSSEQPSTAVSFCKSNSTSMGDNLLVPDPYESFWVEVRRSELQGAGEGLFAKKPMPPDTVAAFYNGVRLPYVLGGPKEQWITSAYKIYINADYTSGERMDIPEEYVQLGAYCASLAHKTNHSFEPNCVEWFYDHPRFGVVPCLKTTRFIDQGEELLLDYEYDPYNCPDWFSDALVAYKDHICRSNADEVEDELKRRLNPKYHRFLLQ